MPVRREIFLLPDALSLPRVAEAPSTSRQHSLRFAHSTKTVEVFTQLVDSWSDIIWILFVCCLLACLLVCLFVLFCFVLFCFVLFFCFVLSCLVLCCFVLFCLFVCLLACLLACLILFVCLFVCLFIYMLVPFFVPFANLCEFHSIWGGIDLWDGRCAISKAPLERGNRMSCDQKLSFFAVFLGMSHYSLIFRDYSRPL